MEVKSCDKMTFVQSFVEFLLFRQFMNRSYEKWIKMQAIPTTIIIRAATITIDCIL